jgi:hypothetical protein
MPEDQNIRNGTHLQEFLEEGIRLKFIHARKVLPTSTPESNATVD